VYRNGKTARGKYVTLRYCKNTRRVHTRFSVVVSKKISKRAVIRNAIRRRVYEVIRLKLDMIQPSYDIAVIINDLSIINLTPNELHDSLLSLLEKELLLQ
jgi:ribonuclease P protein component